CTGEIVHVTGEEHVVLTGVGQGCLRLNVNMHLTGVGQTTGLKYVLDANGHGTTCQPARCSLTDTFTTRQHFISLGSGKNEVMVMTTTVTQNPADCSYVFGTELALECRG